MFGAAEAGLNGLELPAHVIAEQLGHRDGGTLVTQLYGHADARRSRRKIHEGYQRSGAIKPLRGCGQGRCLTAKGYPRHGATYALSQEGLSTGMRYGSLGCTSRRT